MLSVKLIICSLLLTLPVLITPQPGSPIFVSVPNIIRVGNEETVLISVYIAAVDVTVSLQNGEGSVISSRSVNVDPDHPQIVKLFVDPEQIPIVENDENLKRYASVVVSCPALQYEDEKEVLLTFEQGFVFIQTDKPIYTPGQTVYIRVINLNQYMTPAAQRVQLDIRTPQNVTVKREIQELEEGNGFMSDTFKFAEEPMFGNWSVVAYYGQNMAVNTSVQFEVKEYVLPTFSVKINPPEYILKTDEEISIEVTARYVYDKPVFGRAFFKVGILGRDGSIVINHTQGVMVDGGFGTINIEPIGDVFGDNWFDDNLECRLYVEVTVVEDATGYFENSTDTSAKFVNSPYTFSWKRTVPYFKRGPYVVKTDLMKVNGVPASRVPVIVSAIATLVDGSQLALEGELMDGGRRQSSEKITNEQGRVDFRLYVTPECETIHVQLRTMKEDLEIVGDELGNNANIEFILELFQSANENDFLVIRSSVENIRPGTELNVEVFIASTDIIPHLSYFVIARGEIVHAGVLNRAVGNVDGFSIDVTYDMVPSARVVAYYINTAGQVIAASFWIEVERLCENPLSVTVVEPSDIGRPVHSIEPSRSVNIKIQSTPGTKVGLLAVDKAVYLLRDFHRLTRDKMYKRMDTYDTGCGPGSGQNSADVFKNAGIIVLTNLNEFDVVRREEFYCSTPLNERRRRSLESQREQYERDDGKSFACKRGHKLVGDFTCSERSNSFLPLARRKLGYMSEQREAELVKVFVECCEEAEAAINIGRNVLVDLADPNFFTSDHTPDSVNFRSDFREMWFFETVDIGVSGLHVQPYTVPGSITEWSIQAVGLSNIFAMCVIEPVNLLVTSDFFIQLRMPYSVVRMEQVELLVTVFNYRVEDLVVRMYLLTNDKVCSEGIGTYSEAREFDVNGNSAKTVTYIVIGLEIGEHPIRISALTPGSNDGVIKKLRVVPEGVERSFQHAILLNPLNVRTRQPEDGQEGDLECEGIEHFDGLQRNCLDINLPDDVIPDSQSCHVSLTGNLLGPVITSIISGLDSLIQLPTGCGEQTMIRLAPNVYTLRYFRNTEAEQDDLEARAMQHIVSGIAREQTYRHSNGAFSAFLSRPGSTWLTAFVSKVFCHASEYTFIDEKVTCSAMKWMIDTAQRDDGAFVEGTAVIHREMSGGVQGDASLTAYVLIALEGCNCEQYSELITNSKNNAKRFLEDQLDILERPYAVAIVTYALALAGSERRFDANNLLKNLATHIEATDSRFWGVDASSLSPGSTPYWYQRKPSAISVETTGYALLAQLALNEISYSHSIVKWLTEQQNYGGGFTSTQDTVIALQALSEYAILNEGGNLDMNCMVSVPQTVYQSDFYFNSENAFVQQQAVIPKEFIKGNLVVNTTGEGIGKLNVEVKYNVPSTSLEECAFNVSVVVTNDNGEDDSDFQIDDRITVRVCTVYLGNGRTSMAILDIGLYTGFTPVKLSMEELINGNNLIERYETSKRSVLLYADHIPNTDEDEPLCVEFKAQCEFGVKNIQPASVTVYDYYNPSDKCTQLYKPPGTSVIQTLCEDTICACVTGQCATCRPEDSEEVLMERGCESAETYVYKIMIISSDKIGEFVRYNASITDICKSGNDADILEGDFRDFWISKSCICPKFKLNKSFMVIGENTLEYVDAEGEKGIKYIIDKDAFVKLWNNEKKPGRRYRTVCDAIQNGRGNCG